LVVLDEPAFGRGLKPLYEHEFRHLPENERLADRQALTDTLVATILATARCSTPTPTPTQSKSTSKPWTR